MKPDKPFTASVGATYQAPFAASVSEAASSDTASFASGTSNDTTSRRSSNASASSRRPLLNHPKTTQAATYAAVSPSNRPPPGPNVQDALRPSTAGGGQPTATTLPHGTTVGSSASPIPQFRSSTPQRSMPPDATPKAAPDAADRVTGPNSTTAVTTPANVPFVLKAKKLWDASRSQRILVGKVVLVVAAIALVTALAATLGPGLFPGSIIVAIFAFTVMYSGCIWAVNHVVSELMAAWRAAMANKAAQTENNQPDI